MIFRNILEYPIIENGNKPQLYKHANKTYKSDLDCMIRDRYIINDPN